MNFRPGIGADGSDTYMPRTVIYDFKGNFGTLKQRNELYEVFGDQSERRDAWCVYEAYLGMRPAMNHSK